MIASCRAKRVAAVLSLVAVLAAGGLSACARAADTAGSGSAESASAAGSAAVTPEVEPEPVAEEPVEQHDFECDYFYLDVPDDWVRDDSGNEPDDGTMIWGVSQEDFGYHFFCIRRVGTEPDGYPVNESGGLDVFVGNPMGGAEYYGTAAGGMDIYTLEVSADFLAEDRATLTLKTDDAETAPQHDYECEYFYVDVSDAWRGTFQVEESASSDGTLVVGFSVQLPGGVLPTTWVRVGESEGTPADEVLGTTSDGKEVTMEHGASPFIQPITENGGATITLK